jgi:hypothetical protein
VKVLIDTNVIFDLALIRIPFYDEADKIQGFFSATTVTDI